VALGLTHQAKKKNQKCFYCFQTMMNVFQRNERASDMGPCCLIIAFLNNHLLAGWKVF
jgi:hypothetical protein